ncbi:MAG: 16S rRNA (cytidine(1402)-2'-O)-methyltransferase [Bryobacteraceae bacterium]|nr:16S rRNA (cytidine(1402)-2'-O)-methyltransferase [Bryobacteraceae bacterium]
MPGTLYIAATPIGNLEDVTYRVVRILGSVSWVACEDTRQTKRLLDRYGIPAKLISFHEHNERARLDELLALLEKGDDIAVVTDAGTPLISDPGFRLVREARERGLPVVPLPGPSAVMAALSAAGQPTDSFYFGGFLDEKESGRRAELSRWTEIPCTLVYFEVPHRLLRTLDDLAAILPDRPVVIAREITKLHEEFLTGSPSELAARLRESPERVRGECTIVIGKSTVARQAPGEQELRESMAALMKAGRSRSDAAKELAKIHQLPKRYLYDLAAD